MSSITISKAKAKVKKESGVVVLPIKEHQRLLVAGIVARLRSQKKIGRLTVSEFTEIQRVLKTQLAS